MYVKKRNAGFTIIELMVTMVILAVVASFAIPSFTQMILDNRIVSQINELSSFLGFARSEAAKRPNVFITLCPSTDNVTCSVTNNWEGGWMIMLDVDGDRVLDAGDGDQVMRVAGALSGGNTLRVTGFTATSFVQFSGNGQPIPAGAAAASSGTLTICDSRGATFARAVVVMVSGQTRHARDENADGIANLHNAGANVSCS